jgi:phenylacetate-CoA ligase
MEPGDVRGLDDLARIPPFSVHDLRASVINDPLWADYIGIDTATDAPLRRRDHAGEHAFFTP